jgi:hypothetical protein
MAAGGASSPRRKSMRSYGWGRPLDVDDHRLHGGQSQQIDFPLRFFSLTTEATGAAAYRQGHGRRDGNAREWPHGRAETPAHGAVARITTEDPQEIDRAGRLGVVTDLASRRRPISAWPRKCRVVSARKCRVRKWRCSSRQRLDDRFACQLLGLDVLAAAAIDVAHVELLGRV